MSTAPLDISVVICAYTEDRWDNLVASVESVRYQNTPPREIIVVIDHNPQLLERLRAHAPDVVAVPNSGQRGLSGARNTGIAQAQGSIVAFLDEDAFASPQWLERLAASYTSPKVLGVGGMIKPVWHKGRPAWFPEEFDWVVGCTYLGTPTVPTEVRNLIGCNMSFRRHVFDTIGGFRDGMGRIGTRPLGCEETELCIRLRQHWPQSTLWYEPEAQVYHNVTATRKRWAYFRSRCYSEGLSKAHVAGLVGASDGLSSERSYTLRTLPLGVVRGLTDATRNRDWSGLGRAAAIISGLAITSIGYITGTVRKQAASLPAASPIAPGAVADRSR